MRKAPLLFSVCVFCLALAGCAAGPRTEGGNRPRPLYRPAPVYPEKAYKEKLSGNVRLTVLVNDVGQTEKVEVISEQPAGQGLAEAAVDAVEKWIWEPARKSGRFIAKWVNVEVRFEPGKGKPGPGGPVLVYRTPARYPMEYKGPRDAVVVLRVNVNSDGTPRRMTVFHQRPSDPVLAKAAKYWVEQWRWKAGHPGWTYVAVKFSAGGEAQENLKRGGS